MASPYDLVPWLQGTPDEPAKIFLQAASVGAQIGQGAVANINRARALNEEARQFDEQQKRAAQFDQIQQGIQAYKLEEAQLHVQKMKLAKDYEFQTSKAEIEIGDLLNTVPPNDPIFLKRLGGIGSRYPAAMRSDVFKHAWESHFKSNELLNRIEATNLRYEGMLDREAGRNERAYDKRVGDLAMEEEKHKNRIELIQEKGRTSQTISKTLSTNDRLAMEAELKKLETVRDPVESARRIDEINAKYGAIRRGESPADASDQALQSELVRIENSIAEMRIDLIKNPKQGFFDFGKDNRLIKIEEWEKQRTALTGASSTTKPDFRWTPEGMKKAE